ncbi:MAG: hypothetical protein V7L13_01345 [Nostoc sp.]|uniref:hypothetical protein n=1 Tax=Nostoc sp. TaxID=1180 RepID=UPI002FF5C897
MCHESERLRNETQHYQPFVGFRYRLTQPTILIQEVLNPNQQLQPWAKWFDMTTQAR